MNPCAFVGEVVCKLDTNVVSLQDKLVSTLLDFVRCLLTQLASMAGPGNCPLTIKQVTLTPSGAQACLVIVQSYSRVTPVIG